VPTSVTGGGRPLSVLYPATMPLYRSLGWELAGGRHTAVIPAQSLFSLAPPDPAAAREAAGPSQPTLRRAGPGDVEAVTSVMGRVHEAARDCGPITWDAMTVGRWLADPDIYAYLCDDGFLVYRWYNGNHALFVEGDDPPDPPLLVGPIRPDPPCATRRGRCAPHRPRTGRF